MDIERYDNVNIWGNIKYFTNQMNLIVSTLYMKKKSLFFLLVLFSFSSFSQSLLWQRKYGGMQNDEMRCGVATTKGGYLFAGTIESHGQSRDIWLMKIDSEGKNEWQQTLGRGFEEEPTAIMQTPDGGYLLVGTILESATKSRIWVIKTDAWGRLQWDKRFGTGKDLDEGLAVANGIGGGYVVAGAMRSRGEQAVWLASLDEKGNLFWEKTWNGLYANAISVANGHYILGSTVKNATGNLFYRVLSLSETGFPEWDISLGIDANTIANQIITSPNSNEIFIMGSQSDNISSSAKAWVACLNKKGKTLWEKKYGENDEITSFIQGIFQDKSLVFVGEISENNATKKNIWLIKIDKKGNTKQSAIFGEAENDEAKCVFPLANNRFILGATNHTSGSADWWVLATEM